MRVSGNRFHLAAEVPFQLRSARLAAAPAPASAAGSSRPAGTTGRRRRAGTPAWREASSRSTYCSVFGGLAERGLALRGFLLLVARKLQRSARIPAQVFQARPVLQGIEESRRASGARTRCRPASTTGWNAPAWLPDASMRRLGVALVQRRPPSRARRGARRPPRRRGRRRRRSAFSLWSDRFFSPFGYCGRPAFPSCRRSPCAFSTAKPVTSSAWRTGAATLQVAAVAPGAARRESERISAGDHMSGFFAGAKPSR